MNFFFKLLIVSSVVLANCIGYAAEKELKVAATNMPPAACIPSKNSGLPGFQVEILQYALSKMGYSYTIDYYPFKRLESIIESKGADIVLPASFYQTPGWVHPAISTAPNQCFLVTRSDSDFKYEGISSLYDIELSVTAGYGYADAEIDNYVFNSKSKKISHVYGENADSQQINMLLSGRVDVMAASNFPFFYHVKRQGLNIEDFKIVHKMGVFRNLIVFNPDLPNAEELSKAVVFHYQELRRTG